MVSMCFNMKLLKILYQVCVFRANHYRHVVQSKVRYSVAWLWLFGPLFIVMAPRIIPCDCWLVGCCLTSHSAIFQLYSDGTMVQFSKFGPVARHPTPWAARGLERVEPTPTRAPGRKKTLWSFTSLRSEGSQRWGYAGNRTRISRPTVKPATSTPPRRAIPYGDSLCRF